MNTIVELIEKSISQKTYNKNNKELLIWCPVCNKPKANKKISININPKSSRFGKWHCWVCEDSNHVKGSNIESLLRFFKADNFYIEQLKELSPKATTLSERDRFIKSKTDIKLPQEFISLKKDSSSLLARKALSFLKDRNISYSDIIKYNIGYCSSGKFRNRVVFPSYDSYGRLNYFSARAIDDTTKPKYLNASVNKSDIIFNEIFINWFEPVILVEGILDAISTKHNAIPLLGIHLSDKLLYELSINKVKQIIMCLDSDALRVAVKHIQKFISMGISVKIIELPEKDPNELGYNKMLPFLLNSTNDSFIGFSDLVKLKAKSKIKYEQKTKS